MEKGFCICYNAIRQKRRKERHVNTSLLPGFGVQQINLTYHPMSYHLFLKIAGQTFKLLFLAFHQLSPNFYVPPPSLAKPNSSSSLSTVNEINLIKKSGTIDLPCRTMPLIYLFSHIHSLFISDTHDAGIKKHLSR